ncbi:MAG: hypothetical protein OXU23_07345 [Candidatus Poribacteria bacterium]|nr:hypothetical protein [Candidatus Poribacteria bacterium]
MNLTIELTTEQIIDLIQQMPPMEKLTVLKELAKQARNGRTERTKFAELKIREICAARGLDWDTMSEDERLYFIDDIVHEDRECNR